MLHSSQKKLRNRDERQTDSNPTAAINAQRLPSLESPSGIFFSKKTSVDIKIGFDWWHELLFRYVSIDDGLMIDSHDLFEKRVLFQF